MVQSSYDATVAQLAASRIKFGIVIKELARGKSVLRATFNAHIDRLPVSGAVLDLGARSRSSSYYRFLDSSKANITFCDCQPQDDGMIQVDLEQPLPFPDRSFDVVMLLFVMNHIWNVANLLKEIRRVCRGHVLLGTSFVHQYTPEPCDFSRFTEEGLARLYREAGFADFRIFPIGHGPCTLALAALQQTAHCAASATLLYPVIWAGDTALTRLLPRRAAKRSIMTHLSVLQADT